MISERDGNDSLGYRPERLGVWWELIVAALYLIASDYLLET